MRKTFILIMAGILFFSACENTGSSTVGTYEKEETSASEDKNTEHPYIDTSKINAGSSIKKDTGTSPDKESMKADSTKTKPASKP